MHIELHSTFQNYTTVISSTEISANNCSPHKLNHGKTDAGERPKSYVPSMWTLLNSLIFIVSLIKSRECFHFPSLNIRVPVISFTHSPAIPHLNQLLTKTFWYGVFFCYPWGQRMQVLTAATTPTTSRVSWLFLLLVQATKMLPLWEASVTVQVLCEMSKYE